MFTTLGSLFIILYINDFPKTILYSRCLLYADDVKFYKEINKEKYVSKLQEDISTAYNWSVG
jgi:hypothetical protein